jgi:hypothetical protein
MVGSWGAHETQVRPHPLPPHAKCCMLKQDTNACLEAQCRHGQQHDTRSHHDANTHAQNTNACIPLLLVCCLKASQETPMP